MKKNWNVAKIFTLLITVLFLASTLFVGCKEPEPTEPTKYMVTYVTNPEGLQVENFPTNGEVEENKTIELPTLTLEGYTFDGWYDGDTKVESPYKVTKAVTLTAKFTENVAPSLPEDGEEGGTTPPAGGEEGSTTPEPKPTPDTTNNFKGNYYAGEGDKGYIEFTNDTDCVVFVVSPVPATYTVADNVATIKGVEDYSEIEIKTTALANDSFSVTYPVEICQMFNPAASGNMVITYTKADKPSSEGGEGGVIPDPEPTGTTYTIPEIDPSWTNIVVYAWSEGPDEVILQATNNSGTVTFKSTVEYEKVIVVKINDSVDTNNVVIDKTSEYHVWKENDVKVDKTKDLELRESNTYKEIEVPLSETKVYLKPNSNWKTAGARFVARFYTNLGAESWIDMLDEDGDGIYECFVPEGFPKVIFCRMNPNTTENNWDNKWNQSGDLDLPTDGKNLFTVPEIPSVWDVSTETWSTYTPE